MTSRPERITAFSAFAALALGALGMVFERAGPSVLSGTPEEFRSWARAHHDALIAQSAVFSANAGPLLVYFAGLRAVLRQRQLHHSPSRVDRSLIVLAGGAAWVAVQIAGQAIQVSVAIAAVQAQHAGSVKSRGDLMRTLLAVGNIPLATALATCAGIGLRDKALPRWLASLSGVAAVVHLVPVTAVLIRNGRNAFSESVPYPVFVAWMVGVAVHLLREGGAAGRCTTPERVFVPVPLP